MTGPGRRPYAWTIEGESHRPHSNPAYQPESAEGVIEAEGEGEALMLIVTGLGEGTTMENTIPWDLIDQDRPITITIRPADSEESPS